MYIQTIGIKCRCIPEFTLLIMCFSLTNRISKPFMNKEFDLVFLKEKLKSLYLKIKTTPVYLVRGHS